MFKRVLMLLLLLAVLIVPGSAGVITETVSDSDTVSLNYEIVPSGASYNYLNYLIIPNTEAVSAPFTLIWFCSFTTNNEALMSNSTAVRLTSSLGTGSTGTGELGYSKYGDGSGYIYLIVDSLDGLRPSGNDRYNIKRLGYLDGITITGQSRYVGSIGSNPMGFHADPSNAVYSGPYTYNSFAAFENTITIEYADTLDLGAVDTISVSRVTDDVVYPSRVVVSSAYGVMLDNSVGNMTSVTLAARDHRPYNVGIYSEVFDAWYNRTYLSDLSDDPEDHSVTVYIKNSQTGALIANSHIVIDALVNGEYYPVVNRTEPSGIFSITLQPTGGGKPNPDGYRLIVTADGYNNPMPEINFTVDDYKNYIHCLLDPIAGGPVNENKTFIDFFVRDMSSNPISGATVKFGKYTLITNSAGYTVFEVDKNNNYSWTVSKSGYGPLTGNAVIGADPRHTINTVLAPAVTPIKPTPIPTSPPIGPTPTMTSPTGEPVSNWLEWFAAHFGMILGGGVEIGKIFMWLCFTVPVGVYVGNQAKAGAAGFMAGAGIVTLFFVLIGWVPIWLVVLLALIIGLLYAKVFNAQDNGGGR